MPDGAKEDFIQTLTIDIENYEEELGAMAEEVKRSVVQAVKSQIVERLINSRLTDVFKDSAVEAMQVFEKKLSVEVIEVKVKRAEADQMGGDGQSVITGIEVHLTC